MTTPYTNPEAFEDVCEALLSMTEAFEPFTIRPLGAPGSAMRMEQEARIVAYRAAMRALSRARNEKETGQ